MRLFAYILFATIFSIGCNADPRCRRETALLRAEIIDLEDRLALATAGISYDDGILSSSEGIVVSEQIISSEPVIYSSEPLEVQHQIFPNDQGSINATSRFGNPTAGPQEIQIETPGLPGAGVESILPSDPNGSIIDAPIAPATPTDSSQQLPGAQRGPSIQRTTPSRRNPAPEIEITLDDGPTNHPPKRGTQSSGRPTVMQMASPETFIADIVVNQKVSGGKNVDDQPGDEGLDLLIQPRTSNGTVALETGELSVDLIDPAAPTGKKLVGHWRFLPAETELFFANDQSEGKGILLHLPWEQNLPTRSKLGVLVTFTTSDGRALVTKSHLNVDPPQKDYQPDDPEVAGWTQRDTRWQIGTHNQASAGQTRSWQESTRPRANGRDLPLVAPQDLAAPFVKSRSRAIKAIPASSTKSIINRPQWRPVR